MKLEQINSFCLYNIIAFLRLLSAPNGTLDVNDGMLIFSKKLWMTMNLHNARTGNWPLRCCDPGGDCPASHYSSHGLCLHQEENEALWVNSQGRAATFPTQQTRYSVMQLLSNWHQFWSQLFLCLCIAIYNFEFPQSTRHCPQHSSFASYHVIL